MIPVKGRTSPKNKYIKMLSYISHKECEAYFKIVLLCVIIFMTVKHIFPSIHIIEMPKPSYHL